MYDIIILGSGPAGLTAGIYTSRANLKTLLIGGSKWGGQLMLTSEVENFPGFPEGILGPELMERMQKQAVRFGTEIIQKDVTKVDFLSQEHVKKIFVGDEEFQGRAVIVATGADTMWLGLPNEQKLIGRGVSSCAPCDAFFFKGKKVIVVGGGDSAMEEALVLAKFASEVTIVHRRDSFRASKIMQDRVKNSPKIKTLFNSQVVDVLGQDKVSGVKLQLTDETKLAKSEIKDWKQENGKWEMDMAIDGMFVAIGHLPNTKIFEGQLALDAKGYILRGPQIYGMSPVTPGATHTETHEVGASDFKHTFKSATSAHGVFAAGDNHDHHYRQAITAAGYGCEAALEAEKFLEIEH